MKIKHNAEVPLNDVTMEGAAGCKVRWLVGEADAAPNFAMRQFELEPGGHTPRHFHPYEHEIFVLEGEGVIVDGDEQRPCVPATWSSSRPTTSTNSATSAARPSRCFASSPTRRPTRR